MPANNAKVANRSIYQRIVRGGIWVFVLRISGMLLGLLTHSILSKHVMEPDQFGLFVIALSIITFTCIVGRFGLDRALVRFLSQRLGKTDAAGIRKSLAGAFKIGIVASFTVTIGCYVFLKVAGNRIWELPDNWRFCLILCVCLFLMTVMQIMAEAFRGLHDLRYASLFDARFSGPIVNLVFLSLLLGPGRLFETLEQILLLFAIALAVVFPIALVLLVRTVSASLAQLERQQKQASLEPGMSDANGGAANQTGDDVVSTLGMMTVCLPIMISQVLAFGSSQADVWIAGANAAPDQVALFGAARRIMLTMVVPLGLVNLAVISSIGELYASDRIMELQNVLRKSATIAAIPAMGLLVILILLPGSILEFISGPFYRDASWVLIILSIGQLFSVLAGSCSHALTMTGNERYVLATNLLAAVFLIGGGPYAVREYGIEGLAVVSTGVLALMNILQWILVRRLLGVWTHASPQQALDWMRSRKAV